MRVQTEYSAIASGRGLWICILNPWCYCSAVCDRQAIAAEAVSHELPEWCPSYPTAIAELTQTAQRAPDSNRTVSRLSYDNPVVHCHCFSRSPALSGTLPVCPISAFSLPFFSTVIFHTFSLTVCQAKPPNIPHLFSPHACVSCIFRREQISIVSHTYDLPLVIFAAVNVFVVCVASFGHSALVDAYLRSPDWWSIEIKDTIWLQIQYLHCSRLHAVEWVFHT